MIFVRPPSIALRLLLLAAVASYVGVAVMFIDGCMSEDGACILATPAVLVFWAPAFVGTWVAIAAMAKLLKPGWQVLPSFNLADPRETAYLRWKGQGAAAAAIASVVYLLLRYALHVLASQLTGEGGRVLRAINQFIRTEIGIGLVIGVAFVLSVVVLRKVQGPIPDDWNRLK